jgi:hypothetical protein
MGHLSRLATRTSETPKAWLSTCATIGQIANEWAGRSDLVVYGGKDAGMGEAIACFIPDTAEIEVSLPNAFGEVTTPEMVGDLKLRKNQYEFPEAIGVIYHEALHARYSGWTHETFTALFDSKELTKREYDNFYLLEESRIEALGASLMPKNRLFLRASALKLSLGDINDKIGEMSAVAVASSLAGLALARVTGGVLEPDDVYLIEDKVSEVLGYDLLDKLREIWTEFQTLSHHNPTHQQRGIELAKLWTQLVKDKAVAEGQEPENSDSDCGKGESGSGSGEMSDEMKEMIGKIISDLIEAVENSADDTAVATNDDLADQQDQEESKEQASEKSKKSEQQNKDKQISEMVFSRSSGAGETGSSSKLIETRQPTSEERIASVRVSQMLERAKYRERDVVTKTGVVPAGRLRTRTLVQGKALESKGIKTQVEAWEHKTRKYTDEPTLSVGVMVDVSGSMGNAMNPLATTAWVLAEAGRRVQAKTAMVYYGSGVFPTLKVGQRLPEVKVYTAPDGTEKFGEGWSALNGSLDLLYGRGARLLVIVSDGHYTGGESKRAKEVMKECQRNGVAVMWISPDKVGSGGAYDIITENSEAVFIDGTAGKDIATLIGSACAKALEQVGKRNA